jgi:hypothetical protein
VNTASRHKSWAYDPVVTMIIPRKPVNNTRSEGARYVHGSTGVNIGKPNRGVSKASLLYKRATNRWHANIVIPTATGKLVEEPDPWFEP